MGNQDRLLHGLYILCEWFMRFTFVNIIWVILNLPVIFIAVTAVGINEIEQKAPLFILLYFILPLIFFPATTAMFGMAREWVFKNRDNNLIVKSYFKYYKKNYKRSVMNGFFLTTLWGIWIVDIYFFYEKSSYLFIMFLTMGIGLFVYTINTFSVTVHYDVRFIESIRNSLYITVGNPVLFLVTAASSSIILYVSIDILFFLAPFFTGALIAYLSFLMFYGNYLKVIKSKERIAG